MSKRLYPFPYKTLPNQDQIVVSSISIDNITIEGPSTYPTYTLTLPINAGTAGQILSTNGSGVLSWVNDAGTGAVSAVTGSSPIASSGGTTPNISLSTVPTTLGGTGLTTVGTAGQVLSSNGTTLSWTTPTSGTVTAVTGSSPISSSGGATPDISLSTVPTTLGGTGLTTVGTAGQVLSSNGTTLSWTTPTSGTITAVTGSSPISSSGGSTPDISLSTVPTTLGGTGLTTVGTAGQVLSSNGTTLSYITPNAGTVTSVSATVPAWLSVTVTNPNTTPAIAISGSSTGTGTVSVLQDAPTFLNTVTCTGNIDISRNTTSGEAITITNAQSGTQNNFIAIGKNNGNRNHAHYGHHFVSTGSSSNYAFIEINSNRVRFYGDANFVFPATTGTNGQGLITDGSGTTSWSTVVTAVSATSPLASSGGTTPAISLSTVPTTLGGTGLTTVGTNGQVLSSNGTTLSWTTPTSGTLTAVTASLPLASSGGATPDISIASSTGTGSVVLNNGPTFDTQFYLDSPGTNDGYVRFVSVASANYIQSALQPVAGSTADLNFTDFNAANTWMTIKAGGNVGIGTTTPVVKLEVLGETVVRDNQLAVKKAGTGVNANISIEAGSNGFTSLANTATLNLYTVGGGGGFVNQSIQAAYNATNGYHISINPTNDFLIGASKTAIPYGYIEGIDESLMITANTQYDLIRSIGGVGLFGFKGPNNQSLGLRFAYSTTYGTPTIGMSLTSGGDVGIGTTTPGAKFVIEGVPAAFGIQYLNSTATLSTTINTVDILHRWYESTGNASYIDLSWIRTSAGGTWSSAGQRFQAKTDSTFQGYVQFNGDNDHGLSFGTGSNATAHGVVERMRITQAGDVGIGTTTPGSKLDVNGTLAAVNTIAISGSAGANVGLTALNTTRSYSIGVRGDTSDVFAITDNTAAAFRMVINISGDVGIGTTTPTAKLDVNGTAKLGYTEITSNAQTLSLRGTDHCYLRFNYGGNDKAYIGYGFANSTELTIANQINNGAVYLGGTGAGCIVYLGNNTQISGTLTTSGSVGIGTTSPTKQLHVLVNSTSDVALFENSATNGFGAIEVKTTARSLILGVGAPSAPSYANQGYVYYNGDARIIINDSGNVGIGEIAPASKLHVNGTCRATNFTTDGTATFTYTEGSFTPRLGAFRRATSLLYELGTLPTATITATYSTQGGYFTKVGKMLTYNCEVRWTISTSGLAPDDYDMVIILPDGFNPNTAAVVGSCLNYPNTITSISNPMGTFAYAANFNSGGQKPIIAPTTGTGQIAYPIFAPGGTQILTFSASYAVN